MKLLSFISIILKFIYAVIRLKEGYFDEIEILQNNDKVW